MIRLQFNENYFIEQAWAQKILQEAIQDLDPREYPPMYGSAVKEALSFHPFLQERSNIRKYRLFYENPQYS